MPVNRHRRKVVRLGKRWFVAAAALIVALLLSPRPGSAAAAMNSPLFDGQDLAGVSHSLADLLKNGKTTVVFFWALRCAPCLREMAALDEIYRARQKDGLEILAIESAGNNPQKIEEILDKLKEVMIAPSYPIIPDPQSVLSQKFSVKVVPQTFLVNKLGEIVFSYDSFSGELKDKLNAWIDALLSGKAFPPDVPKPAATAPVPPPASSGPETATAAPAGDATADSAEEEFEKYRYFGDFYFHKEEYDKAIASYKKGIELKQDNIHVRLKMGEAYAKKKMLVEAREAWEQIIRISPGNLEADANLRRLLRQEY